MLAGDSHEISYFIFFENEEMSSAIVVIGALRITHIRLVSVLWNIGKQ